MTQGLDALWEQLVQYRIVEGDRPGVSTDDSPWYIKLVSAFSGWIAALFLIAFVFAFFSHLLESIAAHVLFGFILLFLAHAALRNEKHEFLSHAGLALSLAGQALLVYAVARILDHEFALVALSIAALEALLFIVMRSYVHRVFCAGCSCVAFYVALNFNTFDTITINGLGLKHALFIGSFACLSAWLWLNEFQHTAHRELLHPLSWGATLALVGIGSFVVFNPGLRLANDAAPALRWFSEGLMGAVLVWVVTRILKRKEHLSSSIKLMWVSGAISLSLVSLAAPGITLGLVLVVVGYHQQNRLLLGIGFIALGAYLARYYYFLDQSLAYKSAVLFACGICCFLIRELLHHCSRRHP